MPIESIRRALIVFVGGGIGASLRALLLAGAASWGAVVPVLIANVLGAFFLGAVFALADETGLLGARVRLFLAVGILGGFTTFSTFGWGADLLFADSRAWAGLAYGCGSVIGGLAAVMVGLQFGRLVARLSGHGMASSRDQQGSRDRWPEKDSGLAMDAIEMEDRAPGL